MLRRRAPGCAACVTVAGDVHGRSRPAAALPPHCLNCGQPLACPRPRFCPACGQETQLRSPTLLEFAQQFGGAYLAAEGALWRSLKLLLKPGDLTRQYLAGRRKHCVLPLRLYLTISVITLLLMRGVSSPDIAGNEPATLPDKADRAMTVRLGSSAAAGLREGVFFCDGLPVVICRRLQHRIDTAPQAVAGEVRQFNERLLGPIGGAMLVLLPSFALWLKLACLNRHLRYTEHLVFALHLHAFWLLALALALLDLQWLTLAVCIAVPWHTFLAMRRVYGGRRWPRLLRGAAVTLLYTLTLRLTVGGLGLWALLS
jgi:hypothetical protein